MHNIGIQIIDRLSMENAAFNNGAAVAALNTPFARKGIKVATDRFFCHTKKFGEVIYRRALIPVKLGQYCIMPFFVEHNVTSGGYIIVLFLLMR